MCGFFGKVGAEILLQKDLDIFEQCLDTLAHRGPTEKRIISNEHCFLGFRRLAILDLQTSGGQPRACGPWWVMFNGEIYNFKELKKELRKQNREFTSNGDAEVLAHAIDAWGVNAFARLEGMFALAAVNKQNGDVLLARDRFGMKPLYYAKNGDNLFFASEARAILKNFANVNLDDQSIARYLGLGLCFGPDTVYQPIKRLEAGSYLKWSSQKELSIHSWYQWAKQLHKISVCSVQNKSSEDIFVNLFDQSIKEQLVSDVPIGVFLSGGIDSGLIASFVAAQVHKNKMTFPQFLSIGFLNNQNQDESPAAMRIAKHLGLPHVVANMSTIDSVWHKFSEVYDEPFADSSALATLYLSQCAANYATVWLSGDGADEGFAGYRHQKLAMRWLSSAWTRPSWLRFCLQEMSKFFPDLSIWRYRLEKLGIEKNFEALSFWMLVKDPALFYVLTDNALVKIDKSLSLVAERLLALNKLPKHQLVRAIDYAFFLENDGLVKMDRASMWHGLEVRMPFLSTNIANYAATLSPVDLWGNEQGKKLLRCLADKMLPPGIAHLPKHGFGVPLKQLFTKNYEQEILNFVQTSPFLQQWLKPQKFAELLDVWRNNSNRSLDDVVWRLVAFVVWARRWVLLQ